VWPNGAVAIPPVTLNTETFVLRPLTPEDAGQAQLLLSDPDVLQWMPGPAELDLQTVREWCLRSSDWSEETYVVWAVTDPTGVVGTAVLVRIDSTQCTAWVGYRTAPWARRRGVASQSTEAVSRFAFDSLGLERLELYHAVANVGSCGVAHRAGYRLEGLLRAGYRDDTGRRWDTHLHARLHPRLDPQNGGRKLT
jgi:RimJ/RimL family protein N-acetyltransferase